MKYISMIKSKYIEKELRFLTQTIAGTSSNMDLNMDWVLLYDMAVIEGVAGILYHHLKKSDIPGSFLNSFETYYHYTVALNLKYIKALEQLEKALHDVKIQVMVLKGASLLDTVYSDIGMRPMDDIDLMVRPKDWGPIINVLSGLDFKKNRFLDHFFHKEQVTIDLHTHALNIDRIGTRADLFPSGMAPVWEHSIPNGQGFQYIRRPDRVDNLLLLAQRLMKHSYSRLIWLVDILLVLRDQNNIFWKRLYKRMNTLGQRKPLSYSLYLLNGIFNLRPPIDSDFGDVSMNMTKLERGILGVRIEGQPPGRIGPLLALFCVPGFRAKILFLLETIFPKKDVIEREFMQPVKRKRIIFYPVRFIQIFLFVSAQFSLILKALIRGHHKENPT